MNRREFVAGSAAAAVVVGGRGVWGQASGPGGAAVVKGRALATTASGVLRGESVGGVRVFRGVPFAEAPVRFRPPVKKAAWVGERDATRFAAAAMQPGEASVAQSEDCLYLNVWTPDDAAGLPVFVWIHGGGFTGGRPTEAVYDGSEFAREGVIVVTVAYRLGVFGFLDVEPLLGAAYAGSANNGLRDLVCALEWVRDHIGAFGGDPARVTVGGESAGAKLTDILMGVPAAQGLFGQMISESGGSERVWSGAVAKTIGKGFGEVWGKSSLLSAAAGDLIAAQTKFIAGWPQHFPLRPEVDGVLVPRMPVATIGKGVDVKRRLLIGTNRDESAMFVGPHPEHDATASQLGNVPVAVFAEVYAKYKAVYPDMSEEMLRIRAVTAEEYWVPSVRVAEAQLEAGGAVWMYRLDFAYASGRYKGLAFHSEDVGLVWDKPDPEAENAAAGAVMAKQIHAAWVAFLQGQTPKADGLPEWPRYSVGGRETMVLDVASKVEMRPEASELTLWDGIS